MSDVLAIDEKISIYFPADVRHGDVIASSSTSLIFLLKKITILTVLQFYIVALANFIGITILSCQPVYDFLYLYIGREDYSTPVVELRFRKSMTAMVFEGKKEYLQGN